MAFVFRWIRDFLDRVVGWVSAWRYDQLSPRVEASGIAEQRVALLSHVPRGAAVIEFGAGTGSTLISGAFDDDVAVSASESTTVRDDASTTTTSTNDLARSTGEHRFRRVVITEPDSSMRARLSAKLKKLAGTRKGCPVEVDSVFLPECHFSESEFDAAAIFFAVSHMPLRQDSLRAVARTLTPGGVLVVMDHGAHEDERRAEHEGAGANAETSHGHHGHGHHGNSGSRGGLVWLWEQIRFTNRIRHEQKAHGHHGLTFEPIKRDIRAAGFKPIEEGTFETKDCGIDMLEEVYYGVFQKESPAEQ